jgi:subtilisin family serine protease
MSDPLVLPTTAVPDELVVHLPHLDLVKSWLQTNGTPVLETVESDERLGLALVRLGVTGPIEPVLTALRGHFEDTYAGWVPLIGKNRHLTSVIGLGETKPHSAGLPTPALPEVSMANPDEGRGVRVGLADSAIADHPDLVGRFVADRSALWTTPMLGPSPFRAGHATFVAGLVLHQAPAAELHVVDALSAVKGDGTVWRLATKLMDLAELGVDVINLSVGCHTDDNKAPFVLRRAMELIASRVLVIASAGNHGAPTFGQDKTMARPTWPAALPDVVAVGATENGLDVDYSPMAPWVTCTAEGTAVSTYLDAAVLLADELVLGGSAPMDQVKAFDGYASWRGTSFSAATVTGAIAAGTVPGKVSAREALHELLAKPTSVVGTYALPS